MILWFLRLFPQFRALESAESVDLADAHVALEQVINERDGAISERDRLEVLLEAAQEDRQQLWTLVSKAIDEERKAYQMHVNVAMQKLGAGVPYTEAPSLPPSALPKQQPGGYAGNRSFQLPSHRVRRNTQEYIKHVVAARQAAAKVG